VEVIRGEYFMRKKTTIGINTILMILEIIALIHDIYAFGIGLFVWYTVDSYVLQLFISALVVYYCFKDKPIPDAVTILHFISAVGLTVTFLIAAFVLAPEGGIGYYFLENVAPINHFIGPLLSVISLVALEKTHRLPLYIIAWPAAVSLFYGIVCLILNAVNLVSGPYFFLNVYEQPAGVIVTWFTIIAVLCVGLAFAYYKLKWRKRNEQQT